MGRSLVITRTRMASVLNALLFVGLSVTSSARTNKPMTNQDVIKILQAKLSEQTITMAVRAANPGFDTSADGLVKLSTAGVPEGVIKAMIEAKGGGTGSAGA